jgi:hypothetical protein
MRAVEESERQALLRIHWNMFENRDAACDNSTRQPPEDCGGNVWFTHHIIIGCRSTSGS